MSIKPPNPYAFPDNFEQTGMTLRDWFAGQALVICHGSNAEYTAKQAFELADAMLAERIKK